MHHGFQFSRADREDLGRRAITLAEAERQLELLESPPPPVSLARACHPRQGIAVLPESEHAALESRWERFAASAHPVKFVPASGAATRMFAALGSIGTRFDSPSADELAAAADGGDADARQLVELAEQLDRLPFFDAVRQLARTKGTSLAALKARPFELVSLIAQPQGLGLASLPKGLIPFHRYGKASRTAFEEHLHEATGFAVGASGCAAIHLTVSPEHLSAFEAAAEEVKRLVTGASVPFEIDFSTQSASSDTLALTDDGLPLRDAAGRLVLRPAGHGALIDNLNRLEAEIVFIKNIDNIAPADRHAAISAWKRRLGGHLLRLRGRAFALLDRLEGGDPTALPEALEFCRRDLTMHFSTEVLARSPQALNSLLLDRLDRPLRVAGVVRNQGEPGGGPFWVRETWPGESGQIVEASQVDKQAERQASILRDATHFNPVDLVCSVRDRRGVAYDLARFTDPKSSFVTEKQHGGRTIRALERPGLWNGAMAGWNTAFVEVPLETFTPVKTIRDLLRSDHQPSA